MQGLGLEFEVPSPATTPVQAAPRAYGRTIRAKYFVTLPHLLCLSGSAEMATEHGKRLGLMQRRLKTYPPPGHPRADCDSAPAGRFDAAVNHETRNSCNAWVAVTLL